MEENKATVEHPTGNGNAERWVSLSGKRVRLHVPVANYEGSQAEIDLAEAERVLARLEELLQPPPERREPTVDLYMSGAWGTSIPLRLTRELVVRWFGPHADVSPFVEGIAGFVAVPEGASGIDDAHDWVAAELEQRRAVSILPRPTPAGVVGGIGTVDERAATSFLAYLIETYGAPALRQLLETYDPVRRDQAVQAAFRQPLGALEEAWIAWIERRSEAGVSFVRFILPLLKPYWKRELEVLAYMGIGLSYSLVLPLASRHLVDTIIPEGDKQALLIFILAIFGYYILDASVGMRRLYVTTIINRRILMEFQERLFAHLLRLPQSFYARMKIGDLLSRINNDLEVVQIAMMQVTGVMPFLIMRAVAAAIAVVLLEPLLGAIVLIVVPIFAISYLMVAKRLGKAGMERQQRIGEVEAALQENLSAHSVIVAFGLEGRMIAALRARLEAVFKVFLRVVVLAGLFETSAVLATTLGQILVLGVGGYLAMEGEITIGTFLAYIGLLPSLFQPIAALATVSQTVQTASGALDRVNELLEEPVTVTDAPNAVAAVPLQREIRLEGVTFAYDADRPVLRDLDLVIPAGTHVAIVGPSGSGKSTVVNLLLRFWDPTEGRVLRDGQDQRDATLASLRGEIGLVFQDTFVFDMTIRENIAIGRLGATDAEVVIAAEAARLHDYVSTLPAGYDTVVGERGVRMSGGQRQRLAIARALLRDPGVLILDEATSALDSRTEAEIWETITQVSQGRTTVNITHRLSVAASADHIVVLDQGRLVEEGTHAELVEAGGLYQRLYDEQTGRVTSARARLSAANVASLRVIPLFTDLGDEALASLAAHVQVEHFPAGLEVVRQGEDGDKLYFVNGGRLVVVIADPQGERQVNTLKTGDYFGEMAVLTGEPRTATVRSLEQTELYSLSKTDFMALLTDEPRIAEAVSRVVAERRAELKVIASAAHDSQGN